MTMFDDIKDFHARFGLEYAGPPRDLPPDLKPFRTKFMGEELVEYISPNKGHHAEMMHLLNSIMARPSAEQELVYQLDALVDLCYVAIGTAYMQGFDFDEAWRRVHAANMRKVRALRSTDSLRGSVYDVVKPPGWVAPDLSDLVAVPDTSIMKDAGK